MCERINHRARKLEDKGVPFIVIGQHEPYFGEAYRLIRQNECAQGTWGPEDESAYRQLTGDPKLCTECLHHRADRADDDLSPCAVVPGQPIGAARAECDGALWEVDLAAIGVHDKQTEDVGP